MKKEEKKGRRPWWRTQRSLKMRIFQGFLKDLWKTLQRSIKKDFGNDSHDDQRSWQDLGKESWTGSFKIVAIILKILKDPKNSLKTKLFENLH